MENLIQVATELYAKFGGVIFIPIILFVVIGIGSQWMLYEKCNLKGVASIVPVWNVIEFLKIMGRPAWQSILVMLPPPIILFILLDWPLDTTSYVSAGILGLLWAGFMSKVYIELCQCFDKRNIMDYILVILFNALYVLSLGLSYESEYKGPIYAKTNEKAHQLA